MLTLALAATLLTAAPEKHHVVLLTFKGNDVADAQVAIVREAALKELAAQEGFTARLQEDRTEKKKARATVKGSILKVGKTYMINLSLSVLPSTAVVASTKASCESEAELATKAKEATAELARLIREAWATNPPR